MAADSLHRATAAAASADTCQAVVGIVLDTCPVAEKTAAQVLRRGLRVAASVVAAKLAAVAAVAAVAALDMILAGMCPTVLVDSLDKFLAVLCLDSLRTEVHWPTQVAPSADRIVAAVYLLT